MLYFFFRLALLFSSTRHYYSGWLSYYPRFCQRFKRKSERNVIRWAGELGHQESDWTRKHTPEEFDHFVQSSSLLNVDVTMKCRHFLLTLAFFFFFLFFRCFAFSGKSESIRGPGVYNGGCLHVSFTHSLPLTPVPEPVFQQRNGGNELVYHLA